jgi:ATP-dependent RNA helicase SUPV3L1/SUV3
MPALALERLDAVARDGTDHQGTLALTPGLMADFGWKPSQAEPILRALGFMRIRKADATEPSLWRRRSIAARAPAPPTPVRPAVAAEPRVRLSAAPSRRARRRRSRRRAEAAGSAG